MRCYSSLLAGLLICCGGLAAGSAVCNARDERLVRPVQVSININMTMVAAEMTGVEGRFSHSEGARRAFYALITRECELLLATIAVSCNLTNANVNIHEQRHNQPSPYIQISGSGTFAVVLKPR